MQIVLIVLAVVGVVFSPAAPVRAAEITVAASPAVEQGLRAAAQVFAGETGHKFAFVFIPSQQIRRAIRASEVFDLIVVPPPAMRELINMKKVTGEGVNLGRVGVGVAVRAGAPVPVVADWGSLAAAIVKAESLVFSRSAAGLYIESLLKEKKLWTQVESKVTRYVVPGEVIEHVLRGRGNELAFAAITVILATRQRGVQYAGPLPPEVQRFTAYAAAPMVASRQQRLAEVFAQFLVSSQGRALLEASGIQPPAASN